MSDLRPTTPSPQRLHYLEQMHADRRKVRLLQAALPLGFFLLWELAARLGLIDPFIFSSPVRICSTLWRMGRSGELLLHTGTSVLETVIGFTLGTLLGTLAASLLWWSPFLSRILDPYLVILNALPKTALGPIFIVWMGAGAGSIIAMTLAISLIVTILDLHQAFRSTEEEKLRLMATLGATRMQTFLKLVLPSAFGAIINALKVNVGLSWVGVIMGEFLVSRAGLGYLIVYGSQVFQMDLVMTTVLILAAAAALMYRGILQLEKVLKTYMGVSL